MSNSVGKNFEKEIVTQKSTEKLLSFLSFFIIVLAILMARFRGLEVNLLSCLKIAFYSMTLVVVGLAYRFSGRSHSIGATAIGGGLLLLLTGSLSVLNYMVIPPSGQTYDALLVQMDNAVGFNWLSAMEWISTYPTVARVLGLIYQSTAFQLVGLLLVLGLSGRIGAMSRLLLVYAISAVSVVAFWSLFPSIGPASYFQLSENVKEVIRPVVDGEYGAELRNLLAYGPQLIDPINTKGLVAFPSFHIILALLTTTSAFSVRWLFIPVLAINLAMLPAVIVHGGHHLMDLFGGALLFVLAFWAADTMSRSFSKATGNEMTSANA